MGDSRNCYQLRLSRVHLPAAPKRWLIGAKHGFGLTEEEAKILWGQLPIVLVTSPMTETQLDRIKQNLSDDDHVVEIEPITQRKRPCPHHPPLADNALCQKCRQSACGACVLTHPKGYCKTCAASSSRRQSFRWLRITILIILTSIAFGLTYAPFWRLRQWTSTIQVNVYPIAAEQNESVRRYIKFLEVSDFHAVADFIQTEANRYGLPLNQVMELRLGQEIEELPPSSPGSNSSIWNAIVWSLKLRYWAFRTLRKIDDTSGDIDLFVLYYEANPGRSLEHSIGLQKGAIAVVHAFASPTTTASNNVVIAHELLHTFGGSDKYNEQGFPNYPEGFAEPEQEPRYPQTGAEIMGGPIPLSENNGRMPSDLSECLIGLDTAAEIAWTD